MLLVDDIAAAPVRGLMWVFQEIANAVDRARSEDGDAITLELQELYRQLERGDIDEETFDAREEELLDELDRIREESGTEAP